MDKNKMLFTKDSDIRHPAAVYILLQ